MPLLQLLAPAKSDATEPIRSNESETAIYVHGIQGSTRVSARRIGGVRWLVLCALLCTAVAHASDVAAPPTVEGLEVVEGKTVIYLDLPSEHGKWIRVLIHGDKVKTEYQGWGVLPDDTEPNPIYRVVTDATGLVPIRVDIRKESGWKKGKEVLFGLGETGGLVVVHLPAWHVPTSRPIGLKRAGGTAEGTKGRGASGRWTVCGGYELPHELYCREHWAFPQSTLVRVAEQPDRRKPNTASIAVVPVQPGMYVFRRVGKTIRGTIE